MIYKRILLKLSGESLAGKSDSGISADKLLEYAEQIKTVAAMGCQIGIVIGGGNIFRGVQGTALGIDRIKGDYMGMMATVINSIALQDALQKQGIKCEVLSALPIDPIARKISSSRAIALLEAGEVVIMAGGTGSPFFTTDSGAALRAAEIRAEVLLKGTRVDGIYSADPEKDPQAIKFDTLTFDECSQKNLKVMDMTAFTLCRDNGIALHVFNMDVAGNLLKVVNGDKTGTAVR
ncbi:MAG: UMP kinase [Bacteroidales bacterium]|jgi:uridylate kinase|nr:UMP kinase [Bacteroidales bacterium]